MVLVDVPSNWDQATVRQLCINGILDTGVQRTHVHSSRGRVGGHCEPCMLLVGNANWAKYMGNIWDPHEHSVQMDVDSLADTICMNRHTRNHTHDPFLSSLLLTKSKRQFSGRALELQVAIGLRDVGALHGAPAGVHAFEHLFWYGVVGKVGGIQVRLAFLTVVSGTYLSYCKYCSYSHTRATRILISCMLTELLLLAHCI